MAVSGESRMSMPSRKNGRFSGKLTANCRLDDSCGVSRSTCEKSGLIAASNTVDGLTRHFASRLGSKSDFRSVRRSPSRCQRDTCGTTLNERERGQLTGRMDRRGETHEAGRIRRNRRRRHRVPFLARVVAAHQHVPVSGVREA